MNKEQNEQIHRQRIVNREHMNEIHRRRMVNKGKKYEHIDNIVNIEQNKIKRTLSEIRSQYFEYNFDSASEHTLI